MIKIYPLLATLLLVSALSAQTPSDLFFVPAGNICAGAGYSYNSWNQYWEGEFLRSNGNVGTVSRQQFMAGFNLGLLDRLNLIVQVPYVKTQASQGTLNGQNGFQDISLNLKGKYLETKAGPGTLRVGGNLGFSTPLTPYLVDLSPINLGAGTTNLSYRQILAYQLDKGFYTCAKANYTYRSNIPNIHREFYFDQGNAYYTNEVQVKDVFDWTVGLGYSNWQVLAEVDFNSYNTLGGSDIRTWDPGFPSNNVDMSTVTGRFDYYLTDHGGLSFSATGGLAIKGRNAGKSVFGTISAYYQFPVWGKRNSMN